MLTPIRVPHETTNAAKATSEEQSLRQIVARCKRQPAQNAPFEELLVLIAEISQRWPDRRVRAEVERLVLAVKVVTKLQQKKARLLYTLQIEEFSVRLRSALRAARKA